MLKVSGRNQGRNAAVTAVLYLAFCFTNFYSSRGILAAYGTGNDALAFLSGGVTFLVIFEIVIFMFSKLGASHIGYRSAELVFWLKAFMAAAFFLSGTVKLLYFLFPYIYPYGEVMFNFLFAAVFYILFICYSVKKYYPKELYGALTMFLGSAFLSFYGFLAALSLLSELL